MIARELGCDGIALLTFCLGAGLGAGVTFLVLWLRVINLRTRVRKLEALRRTMET